MLEGTVHILNQLQVLQAVEPARLSFSHTVLNICTCICIVFIYYRHSVSRQDKLQHNKSSQPGEDRKTSVNCFWTRFTSFPTCTHWFTSILEMGTECDKRRGKHHATILYIRVTSESQFYPRNLGLSLFLCHFERKQKPRH